MSNKCIYLFQIQVLNNYSLKSLKVFLKIAKLILNHAKYFIEFFEFRRIVLQIADRPLFQIKFYQEIIYLIRQMHNQQNSPNKCPQLAIRFSKELLAYQKVIGTFLKSSFLFQNIRIVLTPIKKEDKVRFNKGLIQSIQTMSINYKKIKRNPLKNVNKQSQHSLLNVIFNNSNQRQRDYT
ncbi:hypothetical protein TTHERM_001620834 (macronuclear) [Tetrahymena thermophila SB210]|uniref:Uncharacterized protein n=1 Tax=Tetrahymena thermophila (strain SB210) TaxID=312017 RepID=W7XFU9_TETTS|nr:hypothetical protein TTHERM_001620834 [Tetrahymena thermophila SB210]EWS71704.1 hypothetical protein TTHERM_001620834 [Tetrahymena thermophila SB210]|eukprot:XP_012655761.1 hypothetical protein TTHERM_001620834 [Tetrahymena thermophila SB210]